ncbi:MAG: hypothetical protein GY953_18715, partial [bacterium]|nr:hypothetical protein [bacterium]
RAVREVPGFVALWDFVRREDGAAGSGRFVAHTPGGEARQFALEPLNIIQAFWNKGRKATYADFPLGGRGPFGQAVRFQKETEPDFLPALMVPRHALHESRLDVKGAGSVSMVVWVLFEEGNHLLAGIWHEGTDIASRQDQPVLVQKGRRQYASFAGLAANRGASAVHISENGRASFGDKYARNLAVTPEKIPHVNTGGKVDGYDSYWSTVGFVFDNENDTATAFLNGQASDYWIEQPQKHRVYRWPAKGWRQGQYTPPEKNPIAERVLLETAEEKVILRTYPFTKVRETYRASPSGETELVRRELAALRVNPYWFGHDLYAPGTPEEGGPFTIGRAVKSSRGQGNTAFYGGVAVYDRALKPTEMAALAKVAAGGTIALQDILRGKSLRSSFQNADHLGSAE